MNLQSLKQYIELYHFGGIADFFVDKESTKKIMSTKIDNVDDELLQLVQKYSDCKRCKYHLANKRIIHGFGSRKGNCMIIGLPPTFDEYKLGKPFHFIGDTSGMFRNLVIAIKLKKDDYYVTNIIKCRTDNYDMTEVSNCLPYIYDQFDLVKPKILLIFGVFAANAFLGKNESIEYYKNNQGELYKGVPVYVTYNPVEMTRNKDLKAPAWEDLKKFRDKYVLI